MAKRTKSLQDIYTQTQRLLGKLATTGRDGERYGKVISAANRYTDNITNSNTFKKKWRTGQDNTDLFNRQFPQSTYMGINAG